MTAIEKLREIVKANPESLRLTHIDCADFELKVGDCAELLQEIDRMRGEAAETREACERICDAEAAKWMERADKTRPINSLIPTIRSDEAEDCAAAIRARGKP